MALIKLTAENFMLQVVEHGFFPEQIPKCFNTSLLVKKLNEIIGKVYCSNSQKNNPKAKTTAPTTLSTYRSELSRRILSVPNPKAFLRLAKYMMQNWDRILIYAQSDHSLSKVTYIHSYLDAEYEYINSENLRESIKSKSDYLKGVKEYIRAALGYKYRLQIDLANFYNTIYTHSITWAICGKQAAKRYLLTTEPVTLKDDYELGDCLDTFTRYQKNNETNGILVGPFTSRIISEIILARLDKIIHGKGYKFKRFVDDYKFYFRSSASADESLPKIEAIFNEFNLNINIGKTKIQRYPYEVISSFENVFKKALNKENDILNVLSTASSLYNEGKIGAYKYALKFIEGKTVPREDVEQVLSELTNIMLINPKLGRLIVPYIKRILSGLKFDNLSIIYNRELKSSLEGELEEEALLFVNLIKELDLNISAANMILLLASDNDLAIIIALDIWKNRNKSVLRNKSEARNISLAVRKLCESLNGEKYSGSRWLLLYEMKMHKLVKDALMPSPEADSFFQLLEDKEISFYNGIKDLN